MLFLFLLFQMSFLTKLQTQSLSRITTLMDQLKQLTTPKNYDKFDKKIADKEFLLGRFYDATVKSLVSPVCQGKHHNVKKFTKSKMRKLLEAQLKIHDTLSQGQRQKVQDKKEKREAMQMSYQFYVPLNRLWCRYMADLLEKQKNQQSKELKVLRSDFHGALITVVHSKNETLVGLEGIVIKQTLRTFEIVIKTEQVPLQNRLDKKSFKTICKDICIFLIHVSQQSSFIINGSSLVYRPSDRIRHKFKFKKADKINHNFLAFLSQIGDEEKCDKKSLMYIEK